MKIYVKLLLAIFFIIKFGSSEILKTPESNNDNPEGRWETKTEWKVKLVKEWTLKTIYVPYWKKVWTPVEIREWIPYPKPPPGWSK